MLPDARLSESARFARLRGARNNQSVSMLWESQL